MTPSSASSDSARLTGVLLIAYCSHSSCSVGRPAVRAVATAENLLEEQRLQLVVDRDRLRRVDRHPAELCQCCRRPGNLRSSRSLAVARSVCRLRSLAGLTIHVVNSENVLTQTSRCRRVGSARPTLRGRERWRRGTASRTRRRSPRGRRQRALHHRRRNRRIAGVGDCCSCGADFEFALACEDEAVRRADDRTRSNDNGGEAEERQRDERVRRDHPGQRHRSCGHDVRTGQYATRHSCLDAPAAARCRPGTRPRRMPKAAPSCAARRRTPR